MTVAKLRESGYKVRVIHSRKYKPIHKRHGLKLEVLPCGGHTRVLLENPSGKRSEGVSVCSDADNYNKKLGVRIALDRALLDLTD